MANYIQGETVRVSITFREIDGRELVDPTVLICKLDTPNETPVTYTYGTDPELIRESVGMYHCHIDTEVDVGLFKWRFEAEFADATKSARQGSFTVIAANI